MRFSQLCIYTYTYKEREIYRERYRYRYIGICQYVYIYIYRERKYVFIVVYLFIYYVCVARQDRRRASPPCWGTSPEPGQPKRQGALPQPDGLGCQSYRSKGI